MKLNLGCGKDLKEGYINIDLYDDPLVTKSDVKNLSFIQDAVVDEIYAKDVLEHMSASDGEMALKEWSRVLKVGGKIFIQTINLDRQIEAYLNGVWSIADFNYMLFAGLSWTNRDPHCEDFHKCAYNAELLNNLLLRNNIKISYIKYDEIDDLLMINPRSHNLNLMIFGEKI
jgi:predicted SAM-dependent methyltransferase